MSEKSIKKVFLKSVISSFADSFFKKNIDNEPRYAGHLLRFLSIMVDFCAISIFVSMLDQVVWAVMPFCKAIDAGILQKYNFGEPITLAEQNMIHQTIKCHLFTRISIFSFILSSIICLWMYKGVTPGGWLFRIRIIDAETGKAQLSFRKAIIRFFSTFVSMIPLCLGYLWVMFDKRGRTWHDIWSKTYVIHSSDVYRPSTTTTTTSHTNIDIPPTI